MRFLSRIFLFSIFYLLFSTFYSIPSFASENFSTSYEVTYDVLPSSVTNVKFDVRLTNRTNQYYASSYKIELGFEDFRNVKAFDEDGTITPNITKHSKGSTVDLVFNKRVVGLNNTLSFNISLESSEIAKKLGNIWEINIPGIANQDDFSQFDVVVKVPPSLGVPTYIKPYVIPQGLSQDTIKFTKEQLGKSGISISYGSRQIYEFTLSYHLKNSNVIPVQTEIAIPPTTNYQEVAIEEITPKPENVVKDADGNWLARYFLYPSERKDVTVKGKAYVSLYPKKQEISDADLKRYLEEKPYWETSNAKIKELAKTLKTPQAIYSYVVNELTYDFSRVETSKPRLGASEVLKQPYSAVCLEFTDLFIAIARSAGIPAREVNGFAYTENARQRPLSLVKDVLHAWPEYYDYEKQTWVMIDPTWGNTTGGVDYFYTLDFDHFAFVIKGDSSEYPIPAGGYKLKGEEDKKDVYVAFGTQVPSLSPQYSFNVDIPNNAFSAVFLSGSINVENAGAVLLPPKSITVESSYLLPKSQTILFEEIPPFGKSRISFGFKKTPLLTNKRVSITITSDQSIVKKTVFITPFALNKTTLVILGGVIFGILTIIISIIATRTWYLSVFRQKP